MGWVDIIFVYSQPIITLEQPLKTNQIISLHFILKIK